MRLGYFLAGMAMALPTAAQAEDMSVGGFLARAEAVQKMGVAGLVSSDLRALRDEAKAAGQAVRAQQADDRRVGRPPTYCMPETAEVSSTELLTYLRRLPKAARSNPFRRAFADYVRIKFPCRKTTGQWQSLPELTPPAVPVAGPTLLAGLVAPPGGCSPGTGEDVVVCARSQTRYRLPPRQGFDPKGPVDSVLRERSRLLEGGEGGIQSCDFINGAASWTGCEVQAIKRAWQQGRDISRFGDIRLGRR